MVAAHPWDAAAEGWDRHAGIIRRWLRDATADMLDAARVAPGLRVLDVAAGAGDQTLDIAERVGPGGAVLATDISPRILALAQERLRVSGVRHAATRVADAQALGLAGANFDAAVCRLGLMFCTEPTQALRSIHAALRPGGRFAALVFASPDTNPCLATVLRVAQRHAGLPPRDPFAPGSLTSLGRPEDLAARLRDAGFGDVEVRRVAAPFVLPAARDYVEFVRSAGSPVIQMLSALPPAAQAEAWADMTAQLQVFAAAQGWEGPNELLLCAARTAVAGQVPLRAPVAHD